MNILIFILVIIGVLILLKLLKVSFKIIWKILLNAIIGFIVLYLLNLIPGVNMTINWLTTILTGLFGIPAVIVIFILSIL